MTDRATVATCLECYRLKSQEQRVNCRERKCPYNNNSPAYGYWCCSNSLLYDAVTLLKEQEAVKPRECQYPHGTYACGFCDYIPIGNKDGYRANYCPECGKAVKWE